MTALHTTLPIRRRLAFAALAAVLACLPVFGADNQGTHTARAEVSPTLFYLDLAGGVMRIGADGAGGRVVIAQQGGGPDGIAIDAARGHLYWTNMGKVGAEDGYIQRANLDGTQVRTIVPVGGTYTPKQLEIDTVNGKLYWSDREGMRIMRSNLDGSKLETLIVTGQGDADRKQPRNWCVGIALDVAGGKLYWSQKGGDNAGEGTIKRASLEMRAGEDPARRSDIDVLFSKLPEPIDLELDPGTRLLYWTDRGDNTISRAPLDPLPGYDPATRGDREILVSGLHEAIGITLDLPRGMMYYTSLTGEIGVAKLDGKGARDLRPQQGRLTGIALLE